MRSASLAGVRTLELALVLGLGVLALIARLPNHQIIPAFTDETQSIHSAYLTARGEHFLLVGPSAYVGPLWDWLIAAAFRLNGSSLDTPRTLMLALGVLTVVATYPLGRAWGGRASGVLAAVLLATSADHIAMNSHVAWPICATPLFTALATWMLYAAVRGTTLSPRITLPLAGLFWGLAFQTHATVLALLPGAAAYLLWQGRSLLRTRWAYLAAALFVLVNLNLLLYNLTSGFDSVARVTDGATVYSGEKLTPATYLTRLPRVLLGFTWHLGGTVEIRDSVNPARLLGDPGVWPIALAAVGGVLWQWRRENPLPGLLVASAVLVLPLFRDSFEPFLHRRYLAPLLPVLYAAVGAGAVELFARLHRAQRNRPGWPKALFRGGSVVVALTVAFLVLHPLLYLSAYYALAHKDRTVDKTNAPALQAIEQIKAHRQADELVTIIGQPREERGWAGGGRLASVFPLALELDQVPYRQIKLSGDELLEPLNRCRNQLVIIASREPKVHAELVTKLELRDLNHRRARPPTRSGDLRLYRLDRLPDASGSC